MWGNGRAYLGRERTLAIVERVAMAALWTALGLLIGGGAFVFAFVIPLLIGNAIVMGYILTNHSLSPLTDVNDPLLNSLSVTAPRLVEILHLDFGLHVEHHLFPAMSSKYAPLVRNELLARWPERYQSMPLFQALWLLMRTPRIYLDAVTLVEPRDGRSFSTLIPAPESIAKAS
jgi:fatty acid desaturase